MKSGLGPSKVFTNGPHSS